MNSPEIKRWDFGKVQLIANPDLLETKIAERPWQERLFSWPWKPFEKFKSISIPLKKIVIIPGPGGQKIYVGHPAVIEELKQKIIDTLVK